MRNQTSIRCATPWWLSAGLLMIWGCGSTPQLQDEPALAADREVDEVVVEGMSSGAPREVAGDETIEDSMLPDRAIEESSPSVHRPRVTQSPPAETRAVRFYENVIVGFIDLSREEDRLGRGKLEEGLTASLRRTHTPVSDSDDELRVRGLSLAEFSRAGAGLKVTDLPVFGGGVGFPVVLGPLVVEARIGGGGRSRFRGLSFEPELLVDRSSETFRSSGPGDHINYPLDQFTRIGRPDNFVEFHLSDPALETFGRSGVLVTSSARSLAGEVFISTELTETEDKGPESVPFTLDLLDGGLIAVASANDDLFVSGEWGFDERRVFLFEVKAYRGNLDAVVEEAAGSRLDLRRRVKRTIGGDVRGHVVWHVLRSRDQESLAVTPP